MTPKEMSAGEGKVVDIGAPAGGPLLHVMDFVQMAGHGAVRCGAAAVSGMTVARPADAPVVMVNLLKFRKPGEPGDLGGDHAGRRPRTILFRIPVGTVSLELIAAQLNLHPKALQRRLSDEDVTFGGLVDQLRRETAERYLRDTRITLSHLTRESTPSATGTRTSLNAVFKWTLIAQLHRRNHASQRLAVAVPAAAFSVRRHEKAG